MKRASRTALTVAGLRRRVGRAAVPWGDPAAEDRLLASLPWAPSMPGLPTYVAERTEFFDEALVSAMERGVQQVVIAGAGYDGRALRYGRPDVTFFEVDHPASQADKRRRVGEDAARVQFVPVDFRHDATADALERAGHQTDVPTHFQCEGLSMYLPLPVLLGLLRDLARRAAPGSTLAVDILQLNLLARLMRTGTALMGEPMVTFLSPEDARALMVEAGWREVAMQRPAGPLSAVLVLVRV